MADLDSASDLLCWDRHALLSRPARIAAEVAHKADVAHQEFNPWVDRLPLAAFAAVRSGAHLLLELPPEMRGLGAAACALTAERTGFHPLLWQRDQPIPPPTGPVVWLTTLPAAYSASISSASISVASTPLPSTPPLDIGDQVRFTDHPVLTLARLLDLFALFCPPAAAQRLKPVAPAIWPESCAPDVPIAANPAKRLALRLNDRIPVFWGSDIMSGIAADWCARHLWYADSMAFTASQPDLARLYSLGRLPRYWPNVAALVRLPAFPSTPMDDALQRIFARRRFTVLDVPAPPDLPRLEATFYLLALGEWVTLYTAALTDSDPLEQTPLLILFGDEAPRS